MECRVLCCLLLAILIACFSESAIPIGVRLRTVCRGAVHSLCPFVTDEMKYIFLQANFQQHFFTSTFSTTFYQRDFPQVLPLVARFSCLSGNLDILCYKSYILLFLTKLLENYSALAQNLKVGRKTFMPGKI